MMNEFYVVRRERCTGCEGRGINYEPINDKQLKIVRCDVCKGREPIKETFVPLSEALEMLKEQL